MFRIYRRIVFFYLNGYFLLNVSVIPRLLSYSIIHTSSKAKGTWDSPLVRHKGHVSIRPFISKDIQLQWHLSHSSSIASGDYIKINAAGDLALIVIDSLATWLTKIDITSKTFDVTIPSFSDFHRNKVIFMYQLFISPYSSCHWGIPYSSDRSVLLSIIVCPTSIYWCTQSSVCHDLHDNSKSTRTKIKMMMG